MKKLFILLLFSGITCNLYCGTTGFRMPYQRDTSVVFHSGAEQGTGTVTKDNVSGAWGTTNGSWTTDPTGLNAIYYTSASNQYTDFGDINALDGMTQSTISVWTKINETVDGKTRGIVAKGETATRIFCLYVYKTGNRYYLHYYIYNGASLNDIYYAFPYATAVTRWYHITAVWTGYGAYLYVDGQRLTDVISNSIVFTGAYGSGTGAVSIGSYFKINTLMWEGAVREVTIRNRIMNDSEILAEYRAYKGKWQRTQSSFNPLSFLTTKLYAQEIVTDTDWTYIYYIDCNTLTTAQLNVLKNYGRKTISDSGGQPSGITYFYKKDRYAVINIRPKNTTEYNAFKTVCDSGKAVYYQRYRVAGDEIKDVVNEYNQYYSTNTIYIGAMTEFNPKVHYDTDTK